MFMLPFILRRGCGNCKCGFWEHDIPSDAGGHPFDRACIEETMPPLTSEYDTAAREGYGWVPRGLRSAGVSHSQFIYLWPNLSQKS